MSRELVGEAKAAAEHVAETRVSKFDQSKDVIPKVNPPRGSKDHRSFRPSTLKDINLANNYVPLEANCCGKVVPIGCGNNLEDVLLCLCSFFAIWSATLFFFVILLKGYLESQDPSHTALWTYFWVYVLAVFMVAGMVFFGQVQRRRDEKAAIEEELRLAEEESG